LIACSYLNAQPVTGRLWVFDLNTKQRTHDIDFAQVVENGSCSDIVTDDQGAIYVTDRELPNIYKVTLAQGGMFEARLWAQDSLLAAPQLGIGQNGAALSADGKYLLTTLFFPPTIFRITIDDPTDVRDIKIGSNDTSGDLFAGADGIVMVNDELFVAFGKKLLKLTSEDDWETATSHFVDVGTAIAAVTFAEGALYALKSDIPKFVLGGELDLPFSIFRVPLSAFD
jgi:sugar lactone lactonase YvrE